MSSPPQNYLKEKKKFTFYNWYHLVQNLDEFSIGIAVLKFYSLLVFEEGFFEVCKITVVTKYENYIIFKISSQNIFSSWHKI